MVSWSEQKRRFLRKKQPVKCQLSQGEKCKLKNANHLSLETSAIQSLVWGKPGKELLFQGCNR